MIGELVEQRKQARERSEELEVLLTKNKAAEQELNDKLTRFEEQREKLYEDARSKANHQVSQAKKKLIRLSIICANWRLPKAAALRKMN